MIRINLIPPEILQQRKDEAVFKWVWLGAAVAAVVLALFWGVMFIQVMATTRDVASIQQQAAQLTAQTSQFQIFQQKQADLNVRKSAVAAAIKGRVDWARMLNELGLVLPSDIYLTSFTGTDNSAGGSDSVVTMAGKGVDEPDDTPDNGYKSVAKLLVRLADMTQLSSVWLSNMSLGAGTDTTAPMIDWSVTAKLTPSAASSSTAGN